MTGLLYHADRPSQEKSHDVPPTHSGFGSAPHGIPVVGCAYRAVPTEELKPAGTTYGQPVGDEVSGIVTASGKKVMFDEPVKPVADTLYAQVAGEPYSVTLDEVDRVIVKRVAVIGVLLSLVFTAVFLALLSVRNWEPF